MFLFNSKWGICGGAGHEDMFSHTTCGVLVGKEYSVGLFLFCPGAVTNLDPVGVELLKEPYCDVSTKRQTLDRQMVVLIFVLSVSKFSGERTVNRMAKSRHGLYVICLLKGGLFGYLM